jgi:hypothetical protein
MNYYQPGFEECEIIVLLLQTACEFAIDLAVLFSVVWERQQQ